MMLAHFPLLCEDWSVFSAVILTLNEVKGKNLEPSDRKI